MSSPIWTPVALSSEARPYEGLGWRVVEAQHRVSTVKLVESLDDQALLEDLLDASKPPVPPECAGLDYLLFTPFRYDAPYPTGSRFRRPGRTEGVFYAAEAPETAMAELAFHRARFFRDCPSLALPREMAEFTAFAVLLRTDRALDLTAPPLSADRAVWTHPTAYEPCQALADAARGAGIVLLRYEAVRDPAGAANLALLRCAGFGEAAPRAYQTWRMRLTETHIQAICERPYRTLEFARSDATDQTKGSP